MANQEREHSTPAVLNPLADHWDMDGSATGITDAEMRGGKLTRLLASKLSTADAVGRSVPPTALLLSLLCLAVPVIGSAMVPEWMSSDPGVLIWILALVPPFLLSYYRGWRGAAISLAAGMAAFSVGNAAVVLFRAPAPSLPVVVGGITVLVLVSVGSGLLSSVFQHALRVAREQALIDPLTGLPNRRHAMLHLHRMFAAARRGRLMSLVMFELDDLETIEERHGRKAAERTIASFSRVLLETTRTMNVSARIGEDEFISVLDGVTGRGALVFVERVQEGLAEKQLPWGAPTVSAGIAEYERGMAVPDVLIAAADQGLYRAKQGGGNRVVLMERRGNAPWPAAADTKAGRGTADPPEGEGETILVVDDEPGVTQLVTRVLMESGYQVLEARSPSEALDYAEHGRKVDLVVTDIVMPEMSGFRLVEALSERRPDLRALYISGYSQEEIEWAGVPGSAKSFLSKPFQPSDLVSAVGRVLGEQSQTAPAAAPEGCAWNIRMRGDGDLIAHIESRLAHPSQEDQARALHEGASAPAPDILVIEDLDSEVIERWRKGDEPLPDLVIALNMSWSARIQALEAGVIDVLPHDMLAGELEARLAGAIRRRSAQRLAGAEG